MSTFRTVANSVIAEVLGEGSTGELAIVCNTTGFDGVVTEFSVRLELDTNGMLGVTLPDDLDRCGYSVLHDLERLCMEAAKELGDVYYRDHKSAQALRWQSTKNGGI